jgi:hypothetical protein
MENVESFLVDIDGQVTESPANIIDTGDPDADRKRLYFDLTPVAEGKHKVIIRAKNMWGVSEAAPPFLFTKALPSTPTGIRLEEKNL